MVGEERRAKLCQEVLQSSDTDWPIHNMRLLFYLLLTASVYAGSLDEIRVIEFLNKHGYLPVEGGVYSEHSSPPLKTLASAIRELQRIGDIYGTGQLDNQTLELLERPRCYLDDKNIVRLDYGGGWRPIPSKTDRMQRLSYKVRKASKRVRQIEHALLRRIVYDVTSIWEEATTGLEFVESDGQDADIEITFESLGDGTDNRTLALILESDNKTEIQFNDNLNWTYHPNTKDLNLKQVLLHLLGHVIGLEHSDHPQSVMYPYYRRNTTDDLALQSNDVLMIQRLYGTKESINISSVPPETTQKTISVPAAKSPSNLPVDPCNSNVDAVEVIDNHIFMFRNEKYWKFSLNGSLVSRPRSFREYWPELLTWPVDAILEIDGNVLFFIENQILTFNNRRLKSTQNLTGIGLPPEVTRVRLAYKWIYGDVSYFVWNETHYWKLDVRTMKPEVDYPRLISNIWRGIPDSVSAAFTWGNELFFVDAGEMYKFDSFKMNVSRGYPRRFSHLLDHCSPKIEP